MDNNTKDLTIKQFGTTPRHIYINDEISNVTLSQLKKDLFDIESGDLSTINENYAALLSLDQKVATAYKNSVVLPPIEIHMCSPGGSVYTGLAMYDLIKKYNDDTRYRLSVHLDGVVASMASIVMLGADVRIASRNTSFLLHSLSAITMGKLNDMIDDVNEAKRLDKICKEIYMSSTKLTLEKLEEVDKFKKDWWLSAEDALKYGLITEIK